MMKLRFNLTIQKLPPTDNHLYGQTGHRRFMYQEAKDWKEYVTLLAKMQRRTVTKEKVRAKVDFFLKRDRDTHGSLKVLYDSLEGVVYENDKQIYFQEINKYFDKENPRIEIEVWEV